MSNPFTNIFNGDKKSTYAIGDSSDFDGATGTLAAPVSVTGSIKLFTTLTFGTASFPFGINGQQLSEFETTTEQCERGGDSNGTAFIITGVDTLTSIQCADSAGISAVETDGRLLVDQGVWNLSENWSDYVTGKYDTRGYEPAKAFDGNLGDKGGSFGTPASVWTPDTPLTSISKFRIHGVRINDPGNTIKSHKLTTLLLTLLTELAAAVGGMTLQVRV